MRASFVNERHCGMVALFFIVVECRFWYHHHRGVRFVVIAEYTGGDLIMVQNHQTLNEQSEMDTSNKI